VNPHLIAGNEGRFTTPSVWWTGLSHARAGIPSPTPYDVPGRNVGPMVTCSFCGTTVEAEDPPLTWTTAVENGKPRVFCDQCSRTHLRAMESKLDSEWW
jgi:hypothetical protein